MVMKSKYMKAIAVGLSVGFVLGLTGCGTEKEDNPQIDVGQEEIVEGDGVYIDDSEEPSDEASPAEGTAGNAEEGGVWSAEPVHPPVAAEDTALIQKQAEMFSHVYEANGLTGNMIYSPMSVDYVVGMLANGASDEVKAGLEQYFGKDASSYNADAGRYIASLPDTVSVANAIFLDSTAALNDSVVGILEADYRAGVQALDFGDSPAAVAAIDSWCSENTNGLINHLIDDTSNIRSIVANALYFKQDWMEQVPDSDVWSDAFHNKSGSESDVEMMHFSVSRYVESDQAKGFIKEYEGGRYSFIGILPDDAEYGTVADIGMEHMLPGYDAEQSVSVTMPEFRFDSELLLTDAMASLDAFAAMFQDGAFPGFLEDESLVVDLILQKAKVDVNREGTEAAAVTAATLKNDAIEAVPDYVELVFDRPFVFMIYDNEMDEALFIGCVNEL